MRETSASLVTQIVARDVATSVEMARSIGYKMPENFDVGVLVVEREGLKQGERIKLRIRLDDAFYDSIFIWPYENGLTSGPNISRLLNEAFAQLRSGTMTVVHVWLTKHHVNMTPAKAKDMLKRFRHAAALRRGPPEVERAVPQGSLQTQVPEDSMKTLIMELKETTDMYLTCVVCQQTDCEFEFFCRTPGRRLWIGVHLRCAGTMGRLVDGTIAMPTK